MKRYGFQTGMIIATIVLNYEIKVLQARKFSEPGVAEKIQVQEKNP